MPSKQSTAESLAKLLDTSDRPLYIVDAQRRIAFCNAALAAWIDLEPKRIIGRRVEFHSEPAKTEELIDADSTPLTDLCPPPSALAGESGTGTISCLGRDGHLYHRNAEFIPLGQATPRNRPRQPSADEPFTVLVLLAPENLTPQQLASNAAADPTADELHRTIRRFRRGQADRYSIRSLLGSSPAMQRVRSQVTAAAASNANTLICGRHGSGRSHAGRAIHYQAAADQPANLLLIDCRALTDDLLTRTLDRLRPARTQLGERSTLLIEHLERMQAEHQAALLNALRQNLLNGRIVTTLNNAQKGERGTPDPQDDKNAHAESERKSAESSEVKFEPLTDEDVEDEFAKSAAAKLNPELLSRLSTIVIRIPRLANRLEDLPVIAQYFLEACNRASSKQVGSIRADALDALALYSWPGELEQLRKMIEAAHAACTSHLITATDLPPIFYQAFRAAAHARQRPDPIVLDELLGRIEQEAITRALALTGGNKSEAAGLLGMTRPRLYRRLIQLGMITPEADVAAELEAEAPEFIEQASDEGEA